jgi:hypothetical protein
MDRVILLQFGGSVNEQFEIVGMRPHVLTFENPPSFNELVARVKGVMNTGCDLRLHGRYNMGGNIPIYMMLPLGSEDECQLYKSCASQSGLNGAKVVGVITLLSAGEINVHEDSVTMKETIADPILIEQPSQEELQVVTHTVSLASELVKTNSEALNLAVVTDEFDADTFDENVDTEQHVEEDDETARSENDEELTGVTPYDVPISSRIDWGSYYTDEEFRVLKLKHIALQDYLNHKDVSQIWSALCDSVVVDDEGNPRVQEKVIKKGQMFETLDTVKLFFQDYAVRHHRPYYVAKSNKSVRYIIKCKILSYSWGVWIRRMKMRFISGRCAR